MFLKLATSVLSYSYAGANWVGENLLGIPFAQMGKAAQGTAAAYSGVESTASVFNYQEDSVLTNLAQNVVTSTITTAVMATAIGSVAAGSLAIPGVAVLASAALTSTVLFSLESFVGKWASDYTGAAMQYGSAGIVLETATKAVDYSISFVRDDWDQNYVTNYKNIVLSVDKLIGHSVFGDYMASFNKQFYHFVINNSAFNAIFDLIAGGSLLGTLGTLFSRSAQDDVQDPLKEAIDHHQLRHAPEGVDVHDPTTKLIAPEANHSPFAASLNGAKESLKHIESPKDTGVAAWVHNDYVEKSWSAEMSSLAEGLVENNREDGFSAQGDYLDWLGQMRGVDGASSQHYFSQKLIDNWGLTLTPEEEALLPSIEDFNIDNPSHTHDLYDFFSSHNEHNILPSSQSMGMMGAIGAFSSANFLQGICGAAQHLLISM